jgi:hypothetical protein
MASFKIDSRWLKRPTGNQNSIVDVIEKGNAKRRPKIVKMVKQTAISRKMDAIKDRYLGMVKKKRRVRRPNEHQFVFEWDSTEDTAVDYNPINKETHQVRKLLK